MKAKPLFNLSSFAALVLLLMVFSNCILSAQGRLLVKKIEHESASIGVAASNMDQIYIFQRSFDLKYWDDVFVMVPDFNDIAFPDPLSDEEQSAFYRLRALGDDESNTIRINLDPTDSHLMTLSKGSELEIHLFGSRDNIGLPDKIENYTIRIGNKVYSGSTSVREPQSLLRSAGESQFTWNSDEFRHVTGYVFVEQNENCPAGSPPPIVEWRVTEMASGSTSDPVFGRKQARPAPEYGIVEGYDVYSYSVPWFSNGYQVPPPVNKKQFAIDIMSGWAAGILLPTDGPGIALAGMEYLGKRAGARMHPLGIAAETLINTYASTLNAQTAAENYDHGPTETFGAYEARKLEVRAIIPNSETKTDWRLVSPPVAEDESVDLILGEVPCRTGGSISITQDFSFQIEPSESNTSPLMSFNFSSVLVGVPATAIDRAEWEVNYSTSETAALLDVSSASPSTLVRNASMSLDSVITSDSLKFPIPDRNKDGIRVKFPTYHNWSGQAQILWSGANTEQVRIAVPSTERQIRLVERDSRDLLRYFDRFELNTSGSFSQKVFRKFQQINPTIIEEYDNTVSGSVKITVYYNEY